MRVCSVGKHDEGTRKKGRKQEKEMMFFLWKEREKGPTKRKQETNNKNDASEKC